MHKQKEVQQELITSLPRIEVANIEIRVMKVGSKQMTQAVFQQLPESSVIDDNTGSVTGTLWGRVKFKDNWHVVFVRGDQLLRCHMPRHKISIYDNVFLRTHAYAVAHYRSALADRALMDGSIQTQGEWIRASKTVIGGDDFTDGWVGTDLPYRYHGEPPVNEEKWATVNYREALSKAYRDILEGEDAKAKVEANPLFGSQEQRIMELALSRIRAGRSWLDGLREHADLFDILSYDQIPETVDKISNTLGIISASNEEYAKSVDAINSLGQLFIAV